MELVTNIVNSRPSVSVLSTAKKLATENAAKESAKLKQKLMKEMSLKSAALKEKAALTVLLSQKSEALDGAHKRISELEAEVFELTETVNKLKEANKQYEKKIKKEKKQEQQEQEVAQDSQNFTVAS